MKVTDKREKRGTKFDDLRFGQFFCLPDDGVDDIYIRTELLTDGGGCECNAVDLSTGDGFSFDDDEKVEVLTNIEIIIK